MRYLGIGTTAKYKADANPQENKSNQDREAKLLEKVFKGIHISFIITTKVLIKAFPYQATYHQWKYHGNNAENNSERVIHGACILSC